MFSLQVPLGAVLAIVVAIISRRMRLLSTSGAVAAAVLGFVVFGIGGLAAGVPLLTFFLSSSLFSRTWRGRKAATQLHYDKTSTRDAGQVLGNGAVAGILVTFAAANASVLPSRHAMLLYLASLAAVTADTWSTEIGSLWRGRPYLVSTFRRVDPGISGAVSPLGLFAGVAGSFFIAFSGWLAWPSRSAVLLWKPDMAEILAVGWGGFVASFADSILGAGIQAQYRCAACGKLTESRFHCDGPAILKRGHPWMTNDVVNLLASLMGALFTHFLLGLYANPR